ncbi:hypothetical protein GCM10010404_10900 [Nonomuraea africana]|uniref:Peptidase inhibitor family I36 n=1 Tax=Nonomuraea africana TaxID=46171 RepID=A0ABR9K8N6_9ACTN|nr:peptidase inhibitor family I36 protein [Nonomuraea africana]MBE1558376.1 hypothetical protein [Nonomuraea africana]
MKTRLAVASALLVTFLPVPAAQAAVRPDTCAADAARALDSQLERHPGGTRVDGNTVSYDGGALAVHVFPETCEHFDGLGDCDSGVACFWEKAGYAGTQWVLSAADRWTDLRIGGFGSTHNNHAGDLLLRGARNGATVKVFRPDTGSRDTLPQGHADPVGRAGWACLRTGSSRGCA